MASFTQYNDFFEIHPCFLFSCQLYSIMWIHQNVFFHSSVNRHVCCPSFGVKNKAAMTIPKQVFAGICFFSFVLGKYVEEE